jgi:hypothetical protein
MSFTIEDNALIKKIFFFCEMSKKRQRCAVVNLDFSKTTIIPE